VQRLAPVRLLQEQADTVKEHARDRLVIAFAIRIHAADALVVAADQVRELGFDVDIPAPQQQVGGGRQMGLVRPFGARKRPRDQPFADMLDVLVTREKARR
jgi:hypothetical protein